MSLFFASLNSGSNGNCYYIGNQTDAVLVDVGISCRETEKRLKNLNLDIKNIKAIFISHEHGDHIKGVAVLAHKYQLPIFITNKTAKFGPNLIGHLSNHFDANYPITIGSLEITAFSKKHDAIDPHSFIVSDGYNTVGVFTDIGSVCKNVIENFKKCHAIFLESNYDNTLLENGKYPIHLKNRIRGGQGHLSNSEAVDLFLTHKPSFMSYVILSHLSNENNSPELALKAFAPFAKKVQIIVASRHQATEVYSISSTQKLQKAAVQINLF